MVKTAVLLASTGTKPIIQHKVQVPRMSLLELVQHGLSRPTLRRAILIQMTDLDLD